MRGPRLALLGLAIAPAWAGASHVPPEIAATCPQVHVVHGGEVRRETLDILVLSDGFTEETLDLYRCGTALVFDRLLAMPPFDRVAGTINVFRIDLAAPRDGVAVAPQCPESRAADFVPFSSDAARVASLRASCAGVGPGEPLFEPGAYCAGCGAIDLGVFHDPEVSPDCRVLWTGPAGLRRIWKLTRCAPDVDVVVVIANSSAQAGAGTGDGHPPVSVVTLEGIEDAATRAVLLAHELGHALGLLDEYPEGTGEAPEFHAGRNVVRRLPDETIETPPWAPACTAADGAPGGACEVVRGTSCLTDPPPSQVIPDVGLIEGAFYKSCGFFRASDSCILDKESSYCVGCRVYLDRLFEDLGMRAPVSGTPPAR